jgi:hypothetical protein
MGAFNKEIINCFTTILGGIAASGNQFVFIAPARSYIKSIKLVSDTATETSNGTNNFTFQVANLTKTLDLKSAVKTTNGAEIGADTAYDLGLNQNQTVDANDVLELQIVKNASPTDLTNAKISVVVEWFIATTAPVQTP